MASLSAAVLETRYGTELAQNPGLGHDVLLKVLLERYPRINVTGGAVREWIKRYRLPEGAVRITSAAELDEKYGQVARTVAAENHSPFLLDKALRIQTPPQHVSEAALKTWLSKYTEGTKRIDTHGHLELHKGKRIWEDAEANGMDAQKLSKRLRNSEKVTVEPRTCQAWLERAYAYITSGKYLSVMAVKEGLGQRLRLDQYKDRFADDAAVSAFSVALAEGQPPALVEALLLRQWSQKYHPDSGPIKVDTVGYLEEVLGDDLRTTYAGMKYKALRTSLPQRLPKAVLVSENVSKLGCQVCQANEATCWPGWQSGLGISISRLLSFPSGIQHSTFQEGAFAV